MKILVFKDIKNNRWTIWNESRTKHLGYAKKITLKNAELVVVESKRKQVLKTKKRFPHAWIVGEKTGLKKGLKNQVVYNPFKMKQFQSNNKPVKYSKLLLLDQFGKVWR